MAGHAHSYTAAEKLPAVATTAPMQPPEMKLTLQSCAANCRVQVAAGADIPQLCGLGRRFFLALLTRCCNDNSRKGPGPWTTHTHTLLQNPLTVAALNHHDADVLAHATVAQVCSRERERDRETEEGMINKLGRAEVF